MSATRPPTTAAQKLVSDEIARHGGRAAAEKLGLDRTTLAKVARGAPVTERVHTVLGKFVPRVREESEFKTPAAITAPPLKQGPYVWDLETIRTARDAQLRGQFALPVRMAEAMRTDDALFNPYRSRCTTQQAISTRLVAAAGSRGEVAARKSVTSVFAPRSVIDGIHGTLVNHGIAIGFIRQDTSEDGTRVDMHLSEWPLEYVRWRPWEGVLITQTREGPTETINHGDGQWIVFRAFKDVPWTQHACILPAALVWAAHANGIRDWAQASKAHGQAKVIGKLADGVSLAQSDGTLTSEASAFLNLLQAIISGDAGAGIAPAGSEVDFVANNSTAWQVFSELTSNREKAGARVYLGTDALLGSVGGAPGIDIAALFQIASTLIQGDCRVIEEGLRTGLYEPWAAINFGDSRHAPRLEYMISDPDAEEEANAKIARREKLLDLIDRYVKSGLVLDQGVVNKMAADLGVDDPPTLATKAAPIAIDPADLAKAVTVNEVRAANLLPPLTDPRGGMTISEVDARGGIEEAKIKAAAAESEPLPAP